jgi:hypothetical protein
MSLLMLSISVIVLIAQGQTREPDKPPPGAAPPFAQIMAGEWSVSQRMWRGPGVEATSLPPAVAHRRLLGSAILQEEMDLAPGEKADSFTRMAYFEYNAVTSQYEYFSIDSRAPQMMNERSYRDDAQNGTGGPAISLWGSGIFVAPKWGDATNAAFRYRLKISPVQQNRQIVQLYLTPVSGESAKEFLAFEYIYTRRP